MCRYIKTDDDSLAHLPRLEADLTLMSKLGRSHYYYGVMTWRAWTPLHTEVNLLLICEGLGVWGHLWVG